MSAGDWVVRIARWVLALIGAYFVVVLIVVLLPTGHHHGPEPPPLRARRQLRVIASAQQAFSSSCTRGDAYARSLEDLAKPAPYGKPFIADEWIRPRHNGYVLTMTIPEDSAVEGESCNGLPLVSRYFVETHPEDPSTGWRSFAIDERGTLYSSDKPIAPGMGGASPDF